VGPAGPVGSIGPAGPPGPVSNNFSEYIIKLRAGAITPTAKALDTTNLQAVSGSVGGFALKYSTSDNYAVNAITVASNQDPNPTGVIFTLTTVGTIAKAFLSTANTSHNSNPLTITSTSATLSQSFTQSAQFAEVTSTGTVWFLTVRWQ
jgi:hypothetical protein